jgi:hypothetical protein
VKTSLVAGWLETGFDLLNSLDGKNPTVVRKSSERDDFGGPCESIDFEGDVGAYREERRRSDRTDGMTSFA